MKSSASISRPTRTPMEDFKRRVAHWSARLRAQAREVYVVSMSRKWASCSARGRVCFARDLLERSRAEQDFVIVHELLHLRHPNHGPVFHALMGTHLSARRRQIARRALRNGEPARPLLTGEPQNAK